MSAGTPDIYEREGRRFVESGIGTIGWGIYPLYKEVDFNGNVIDGLPRPLEWIFPDPAVVVEQKRREEEERKRLERCARDFPVEGMSGEFDKNGGMDVWATDGDSDEHLGFIEAECSFCATLKATLFVSNDYFDLNVCRDCLGKMFDALATKEGVKA